MVKKLSLLPEPSRRKKEKKHFVKDKYVLMKKINEGGWSKIYLGMDIQTNEEVVVKVNLE